MIWGFIKLGVFTTIAVVTGVLCATVPIGGRTIASRATELWAQPEVKSAVGEVETRAKRGVAAALDDRPAPRTRATAAVEAPLPEAAPPPHATRVDPHKVATVVADAPPGDSFHPSERQAVDHLIQQRARKVGHHPGH